MSSLVQNNNALVFGSQNPFRNYVTEPGLKNSFMHLLLDKSSKIYRSRSWNVFCLANKIFPNKVAEINENIRYGIGKLIDPFIGYNLQKTHDQINSTQRQKYVQGEIALTNELVKLTGIKNTLVMVIDNEIEHYGTRHGIITYITRNMVNGYSSELIASWSNKFFKFNEPDELSMVIAIPKQYISTVVENVFAASSKELNSISTDKIIIKGNMVDEISIDLIKSIFSSIYSDGIRCRVISDILLANKLLQTEGMNITATTNANDTYEAIKAGDVFQKHAEALHQFKKSSNDEHLVYEMLQFINEGASSAKINPYEFYTAFIDTPYAHMENIFSKCGSFQRLEGQHISFTEFNFSNNLSEMDAFYADKDRDIILYGIKLIRYLPFVLFNTYVIGGGSAHIETKQLLENAKKIIVSILGYRASNSWSAPLVNFIVQNINYLIDKLFVELSSPITVTSTTRIALTTAIRKFGIIDENRIEVPKDIEDPAVSE